jgi:hypothetical protein
MNSAHQTRILISPVIALSLEFPAEGSINCSMVIAMPANTN